MEKINEDSILSEVERTTEKEISPLLLKVRQKYSVFGTISLIFGGAFTFSFYKAGIGLNIFLFTVVMILLLITVSKKLGIPTNKITYVYYIGAAALGLSVMMTTNGIIQLLNLIGILLLLDLSLLIQYQKKEWWDFTRHLWMMLTLPFHSLAAIGKPFLDGNNYLKKTKLLKNDRTRNIFIGVIISIPLILIISALLSSADLLFHRITTRIYETIFSSDIYQIILMLLVGFVVCYSIICAAVGAIDRKPKERVRADAQIAITVVTLLGIVYAVFCGIQIIYLFIGGVFLLPEGFTYAEYARRGFFELLAVTCFNMVLILFCSYVFEENRILKGSLVFMTACTYIMIASSAYRMLLYIGTYHLTFLRLLVLLFLFIDALILAGTIIFVFNRRFPLFGFCVAVISISYIIFSFAKPDYYIASYQTKNDKELTAEDLIYLNNLSSDAAPIVVPLFREYYDKVSIPMVSDGENTDYMETYEFGQYEIEEYYNRIYAEYKEYGIRDFNLSSNSAYRCIEKYSLNKVVGDN